MLERFYKCARINKANTIIRVTGDCPLIDIKYINELLEFFKKNKFDYVNNINLKYLPDGLSCEIFNFKSLKTAYNLGLTKFDKEHVTP